MFFKRKNKSNKNDNLQPATSVGTANMQQPEKKLSIEAVERALLKDHKIEDKILLLKIAGSAYSTGDIGAKKDYEKAIEFYQKAADLGSVECLHSCGVEYISAYMGEDQMLFSLGVAKVCDSYKMGFEPARDTLQYLIDSEIFPSCKTVQDLLNLSDVI